MAEHKDQIATHVDSMLCLDGQAAGEIDYYDHREAGEIARRYTACWNFALGSPTEAVEKAGTLAGILAEYAIREQERALLLAALKNLLDVIATDDLIPESVSYMREARAAVANCGGK